MSNEIDVWLRRIKAVEREYYAARFSVDRALGQVRADPNILTGDLRIREIERTADFLEGTYIMRLFAEFESGLRLYFRLVRKRRPPSKTEDLLNSVASRRGIPNEQLRKAHEVRGYRNDLVHERYENNEPMTIMDARRRLCYYFSFLPRDW
ncbi:MAG TPA: hypothetical protein VG013_06700 [Gemmataceae bacterium]|jgi:hypothetical protein|nr:hypothetical protein [Gemmataceae bacterium]